MPILMHPEDSLFDGSHSSPNGFPFSHQEPEVTALESLQDMSTPHQLGSFTAAEPTESHPLPMMVTRGHDLPPTSALGYMPPQRPVEGVPDLDTRFGNESFGFSLENGSPSGLETRSLQTFSEGTIELFLVGESPSGSGM
jgi:hypothetical protein